LFQESINGSGGASNPGNNLYITGLSTRITSSDLEKYFNSEGKVWFGKIIYRLLSEISSNNNNACVTEFYVKFLREQLPIWVWKGN
jgi:RNA recognition motif-containing protein